MLDPEVLGSFAIDGFVPPPTVEVSAGLTGDLHVDAIDGTFAEFPDTGGWIKWNNDVVPPSNVLTGTPTANEARTRITIPWANPLTTGQSKQTFVFFVSFALDVTQEFRILDPTVENDPPP